MINYSQLSEEQLVSLCKEKDDEALAFLTEKYMNVSKYIADGFSFSSDEKADLIQEGMIGFLGAVWSYREQSGASFNTYASCCIRNRIISVIRSANTKRHIPRELIVSLETQKNHGSALLTPEESILSENRASYIGNIIATELTEKEREIFMLYLAGFSYGSIAEKTDTTVKGVDSALQRARKKLKKKLQDEA